MEWGVCEWVAQRSLSSVSMCTVWSSKHTFVCKSGTLWVSQSVTEYSFEIWVAISALEATIKQGKRKVSMPMDRWSRPQIPPPHGERVGSGDKTNGKMVTAIIFVLLMWLKMWGHFKVIKVSGLPICRWSTQGNTITLKSWRLVGYLSVDGPLKETHSL